jgi:acyl dehydratase
MALPERSRYRLIAKNTSKSSDNKIHDDEVAKRFGFSGGLVPGVDVYAYMTQAPVDWWGTDWLIRGSASCRFATPVYDGAKTVVNANPAKRDKTLLELNVESGGEICATGWAALDADQPVPPQVDEIAAARLPDERPEASPDSLVKDQVLGTFETVFDGAAAPTYLEDVRERNMVYWEERIAHPGYLLRMANWALSHNVTLGPWIHVGSEIQHFGLVHAGDHVAARAVVLDNYERKGHLFVQLKVNLIVDGARPVAQFRHTAIYRPRQLTA